MISELDVVSLRRMLRGDKRHWAAGTQATVLLVRETHVLIEVSDDVTGEGLDEFWAAVDDVEIEVPHRPE